MRHLKASVWASAIVTALVASHGEAGLLPTKPSQILSISSVSAVGNPTVCQGAGAFELGLSMGNLPNKQVLMLTDFSWEASTSPGSYAKLWLRAADDGGAFVELATLSALADGSGKAAATQNFAMPVVTIRPGLRHLCIVPAFGSGTTLTTNQFQMHGFLASDR